MSGIIQAGEGRASGLIKAAGGSGSVVTWQTGDIKTGNFSAVANQGFFCNTTSSAITASLPAGVAGVVIAFQDYNNTFDSNALTISPNGSEKINGGTGDLQLGVEGQGIHLVYIDGTVGWRTVIGSDDPLATVGSDHIQATGGTESTCGNFKTHVFTGPGTFQVTNVGLGAKCTPSILDYLVVAGGGSGGSNNSNGSGGGGGGGYREAKAACSPTHTQPPHTASPIASTTGLTATLGSFPITIGAGGAGVQGAPIPAPGTNGLNGSDSIFSSITSAGGGGGGTGASNGSTGLSGGSGGGGGGGPNNRSGGAGNTPPTNPAQGQNGGNSSAPSPSPLQGGGGGGAGEVGDAGQGPNPHQGGRGGAGVETGLAPSDVGGPGSGPTVRDFSGGGGAGKAQQSGTSNGPGSPCGTGGGGAGNPGIGGSGPANSGGGGGAGGDSSPKLSGTGGSGAVVIRYKFQ